METEKESKVTDSVILDNNTVRLLPIAADLKGARNRLLDS